MQRGVEIPATTNLDITPTILTLLGVSVPSIMQGRVLCEAWGETPIVPAVPADMEKSDLTPSQV
jgi:arylsulfatase A-like enzyme